MVRTSPQLGKKNHTALGTALALAGVADELALEE